MSPTRQNVLLPKVIAERLQTAIDLYGLAIKFQCDWAGDLYMEGERNYLKASQYLQDAAGELMEAVDTLLLMHNFKDLDEAAEKEAAEEAKGVANV